MYQEEVTKLDKMIISGNYPDEIEQLQTQLTTAKKNIEKIQSVIKRKRDLLGVDGRASLAKLKDNKFLHLRLKASALKNRIRTRLRNRKFELERLERAYRHTTSNEDKMHNHIKKQVKRHEPGVVQLATKYNKLCADMAALKAAGAAPKQSIIPYKIEKEGLFKLDVDDDIWQDIGLNEDNLEGVVPAWLGHEQTRQGIKAILEKDRCLEEEQRLSWERCSLQEWMANEWKAISSARYNASGNENLIYQLKLREIRLCKLYVAWEPKVKDIPPKYKLSESWGPTQKEIESAMEYEGNASWDGEDIHSDSESESEFGEEDEELMEAVEVSAFADAYREGAFLEGLLLPEMYEPQVVDPRSLLESGNARWSESPHKRSRRDSSP